MIPTPYCPTCQRDRSGEELRCRRCGLLLVGNSHSGSSRRRGERALGLLEQLEETVEKARHLARRELSQRLVREAERTIERLREII
jgi:predicted amidophosphoribosyltransferase